jgi:hypothetical protein
MKSCLARQAVKSKGKEAEKLTGAFVLYSHITHVVHLCARDIPLAAPRIETFTIVNDPVFATVMW